MFKSCLNVNEVNEYVQKKYILTGYRKQACNWKTAFKSVFQVNNETLNFWTHFIPLILMLKHSFNFVSNLDDPTHIIYFPHYFCLFSGCYVLLISSISHMFCCCSKSTHLVCFTWDYISIIIYGLSLYASLLIYICPAKCFSFNFLGLLPITTGQISLYVAFCMCVSIIIFGCFGITTNSTFLRIICRDLPPFAAFLSSNYPCVLRFLTDNNSEMDCYLARENLRFLFFLSLFVMTLGFVVFGTKFPEVLSPGRFDIVGNSHQLFHILTAAGIYCYCFISELTLKEIKENIKLRPEDYTDLSVINIYTFIFPVYFLFAHIYSMLYHQHCKSKIEKQKSL